MIFARRGIGLIKTLTRHLSGGSTEHHCTPQYNRCPGRGANRWPPEHNTVQRRRQTNLLSSGVLIGQRGNYK